MRPRPPAIGQRIFGADTANTNRGKGVSTPRGGAYRLGAFIGHGYRAGQITMSEIP